MKNISTGTGIALLAGAIVAYPILDRVMPRADASATHAAAVVAAATAQNPPTVIWMSTVNDNSAYSDRLYRLWSDGRLEVRNISYTIASWSACNGNFIVAPCPGNEWIEIPPPLSGNGFACRADLDGNRVIDGADLGMVLANWGPQTPCNPEPEYPCMTIAGGSGLVK